MKNGVTPSTLQHRYELVDVFASEPLSGNPLAVFLDGDQVPERGLQAVAAELRLSETVFVDPDCSVSAERTMRIFTPGRELPFAGHPTLGTAHVLSMQQGAVEAGQELEWTLHQKAGPVAVKVWIEGPGRSTASLTLTRPPVFGPPPPPPGVVASALGLGAESVRSQRFASHGVPFLLVELADAAALERAALQHGPWREHLAGAWAPHLALFALEGDRLVRTRVFAPAAGIPEDPATGAAAAALAAHLADALGRPRLARTILQGPERERASRIAIEAEAPDGVVRAVRVAGSVVSVGRGVLELSW